MAFIKNLYTTSCHTSKICIVLLLQFHLQSSALVDTWICAININLDFTVLKSPFFQKTIQLHVTLKSELFYYIRSAVFCLGVDMNFLLYKHRFIFYNIKEPANSSLMNLIFCLFQTWILQDTQDMKSFKNAAWTSS